MIDKQEEQAPPPLFPWPRRPLELRQSPRRCLHRRRFRNSSINNSISERIIPVVMKVRMEAVVAVPQPYRLCRPEQQGLVVPSSMSARKQWAGGRAPTPARSERSARRATSTTTVLAAQLEAWRADVFCSAQGTGKSVRVVFA